MPAASSLASRLDPAGFNHGEEHLLLKWGNLKGWKLRTDASREAARVLFDTLQTNSAMEWLSDEGKSALCRLIDAVDGPIQNDWTGDFMTKDEAKKYVLEYGAGK